MGKVKFFCDCGKEIWQEMEQYRKDILTIAAAENGARCADCFLRDWRKKALRDDLIENEEGKAMTPAGLASLMTERLRDQIEAEIAGIREHNLPLTDHFPSHNTEAQAGTTESSLSRQMQQLNDLMGGKK